VPSSPLAAAPALPAQLQAAATSAGANRPAQPGAAIAASKGRPAGPASGPAKPDGEDPHGAAADLQPQTPAAVRAPTAAQVDGDPATLLSELRARHPPRETAPVPPALAQRDNNGDATAAVAPRLARRSLSAVSTALPSQPPVSESTVVVPPRQPSPATIDAHPVAGGAAAAEASAPPPALAPAGLPQPALAAPTLQAAAVAPIFEAHLPATPGSAEFSTQLGAQLTTFVRDGVQHARLHLNPAEMGPVTVQIQLEGQSAQVHMAAEHGLTRQALEHSMPLLAGSLREVGLTLSGGGVFEQPRQPREGAPGGTGGSRSGDDISAESAPHPAAAAVRRRGVVDLVA